MISDFSRRLLAVGRADLALRVDAAIPVPPRQWLPWLKSVKRRAEELKRPVQEVADVFSSLAKEPDDYGRYLCDDIYGNRCGIEDLPGYTERLDALLNEVLEQVQYPINAFMNPDAYKNYSVASVVGYLRDFASRTVTEGSYSRHNIPNDLKSFRRDFVDQYDAEDATQTIEYSYADDQEKPRQLIAAVDKIEPLYGAVVKLLAEIVEKITAYDTEMKHLRDRSYHGDSDAPPRATGVQTLYHATAFKREILRDGWSKEKPLDRVGLGSYGDQARISFTYDLHIAKEISRSLKDAVEIVNGRLRWHEIASWAEHEGLDVKDCDVSTHDDDIGKTLKLFQWYLWLNKVKRSNPVFANINNLKNVLKGRTAQDCGVLVCDVDLDGIPRDEKFGGNVYISGEREFRVPASAIKTTKELW